jgi:hypothetical protein
MNNIEQQIKNKPEVKLWTLKVGDYNDVFENKEIRGTEEQVIKYCKSYFYRLRNVYDISGFDSIGFEHYNKNGDVDIYTEAFEFQENEELSGFKPFVDLTNEERYNKRMTKKQIEKLNKHFEELN